MLPILLICAGLWLTLRDVYAQFPSAISGVNTIHSNFNNGITIQYKEPGICETTPSVKSFSGYVSLPPGTLSDVAEDQNYTINTFFWFFESRKDPGNAPLAIWLNGGPGSSSLIGLLSENGPCSVNVDSNSTTLNPWSFNNEVNMLYIDQPNQVGFSYDTLMNGTLDQISGEIDPVNFSSHTPKNNATVFAGTFPSQNATATANNTRNSARALWHFAQTWFQEFPAYTPNNNAISVFAESYGGRYGPAIVSFWEEQNNLIANGSLNTTGEVLVLHLDTLGIINGCVDLLTQVRSYPEIAYNNTYGIAAINQTVYQAAIDAFERPNTGCRDRILNCQALASAGDPEFIGSNQTVNQVCSTADDYCTNLLQTPYLEYSGRSFYDIAAPSADPFPPNYFIGYLNAHWVQAALGVPVNFTTSSSAVGTAFESVGDDARADVHGGYIADLASILDSGIKVALIYGDRDYACNWIGGEEVSLAVKHSQAGQFQNAGYANISVNDTYVGGLVRQYGNFSFSRVFESGHEVPAYQPETAYQIFRRAIFSTDIATGKISTLSTPDYSSVGPSDTFSIKNIDPGSPAPQCYQWALSSTCTDDQIKSVMNGSGLIHDYILIDANQSHLFPTVSPGSHNDNGGKKGAAPGRNPVPIMNIVLASMFVFSVAVWIL